MVRVVASYGSRIMSSPIPRLIRKLGRSFQALIQAISNLFLRSLFLPLKKKSGFVLPTATLVLLVVSLLVGTLVVRTGQEAEEAISQQAQQKIYNAATPAVDRAKAKIEFLFQDQLPQGVPSEAWLRSKMRNDGETAEAEEEDIYTLNDEDRLDLDGDNVNDNAWEYTTENGEKIAYSINLLTQNNGKDFKNPKLEEKADNFIVRSGPLNAGQNNQSQRCAELQKLNINDDWFTVTGATLRKNFQINAVATNESEVNPAISTIEVQQNRDLDLGNTWGAWFRYDLPFTPGPEFNWNGAIHTEGSLILNNNGGSNKTRMRLVSAPDSCFYREDASQISMAEILDKDEGEEKVVYQGQLMRADTDNDNFGGSSADEVQVDLFPDSGQAPSDATNTLELELPEAKDSVGDPDGSPSRYYLDPVLLVSEDISRSRNPDDDTNTTIRDNNWNDNPIQERIFNQNARKPYLDDTYRADDRWGPKPTYTERFSLADHENGALIENNKEDLTYNPPAEEADNAGLDGYWERRANAEGLRVIVGQRLELNRLGRFATNSQQKQNLKINFQPPDLEEPPNDEEFIPDTGKPYGKGNNYGWLDSDGDPVANNETRNREDDDDKYAVIKETLNHMDKSDSNLKWQIDVPNDSNPDNPNEDRYKLKIVMGDIANTDQDNSIIIEKGTDHEVEISDPNGMGNNLDNNPLDTYPENLSAGDVNASGESSFNQSKNELFVKVEDGNLTIEPKDSGTQGDNAKLAYIEFLNYSIDPRDFVSSTGLENKTKSAVQAGGVYHWDGHKSEPAACLAMTGHPGPGGGESTRFENITIDDTEYSPSVETDFLNAKGTNGWEFPFYDNFTTEINDTSSVLRTGLDNLAHFAGDPNGAFPPQQEDSTNAGAVTHPHPGLTQWGDFSHLRRAINRLEDGTSYSDLSLAEQTTLQTATCTMGMLAYNLDYKQKDFEYRVSSDSENLQSEGTKASKLVDGNCSNGNPEVINPSLYPGGSSCSKPSNALFDGTLPDGSSWNDNIDNSDPNNPDHYVTDCDVDKLGSGESAFDPGCDEPDVYRQFTKEQLLGHAGFSDSEISDLTKEVKAIIEGSQIERDRKFGFARGGSPTVPDTVNGNNFPYDPETGLAGPKKVASQEDIYVRTGCDPDIFGEVTAKGAGGGSNDRAQVGLSLAFCRNLLEPKYPSLFYLFPMDDHDHDGEAEDGNDQPNDNNKDDRSYPHPYISDGYISGNDVNGSYEYDNDADIASLALTPRKVNEFELPTTNDDTEIDNGITTPAGDTLFVPFLDKAIYDDREKQDLRLLDIDLNLLRSNTISDDSDFWLPTGGKDENGRDKEVGIVYAFREDALREDAIARPYDSDWATCKTEENLTGLDVDGNASNTADDDCRMLPASSQDPPRNDTTGVSAKAVDGYADPDRRPYGFRLRNGADISRGADDGTGLSFITDQPVYIQGDFNTHDEEEFEEKLEDNGFYERSTLNKDFATNDGETWRPTEIIADGITLLSSDFNDQADSNNFNPSTNSDLEVNSILVSGVVPSFPRQYNGGIHNFPRFLEDWGNNTVKIRGSFIQLNFSQYATGPFDQENSSPSAPTDLVSGVDIPHYSPPERNWGYDVGLQYQPPGPVAERFTGSNKSRIETYRELSADDPYIKNLLDAIDSEE